MEQFAKILKAKIIEEFNANTKNGIYAFTQKCMAYNSNKIEGSALTIEQTSYLFDNGTIAPERDHAFRTKDVEEMTGHFKMFNEILKNLDKPLTSEMIKTFHYQLKSGVFEDRANDYPIGEFKSRANQVSDVTTEHPKNVPQRIRNLIDRHNSSEKSLLHIAMFHAEYENIHPFQDGNGRTGRAIIFKQCLDSNIVPVIIYNEDKHRYFHALHNAQTEGKYDMLPEFFKETQDKFYRQVKAYQNFR